MFNKKPHQIQPSAAPNDDGSPWEPELIRQLSSKQWIDINITHAQYNSQFKFLNQFDELVRELNVEFFGELQTLTQFVKIWINFNSSLDKFVGEMWSDYQPDIDLHGVPVSLPILRVELASDIKIMNAIHDALQSRLQAGYQNSSVRLHILDKTVEASAGNLSATVEKLTIWSDLHAPDIKSYARSMDTLHLGDVKRGNHFRKSN